MKHDFLNVSHPAAAAGHALWDWTFSLRGMPLKISILGATLGLAASMGISAALGPEITKPDELLQQEQMKACRAANPGLSDQEMARQNLKCVSVHPGIFGP